MPIEKYKEILRENGYKLTPQRRHVIDAIIDKKDCHMSIDEIYKVVKGNCPEIGIATIYRTVQLFEEIGILSKQYFDDGCHRYEISDGSRHHNHHHLICNECGSVIEIQDEYFDALEQHIEKEKKFKITNHNVVFFGICENCRKKSGDS
ncbi:Fur family transcriptional regulator [Alkalibacter mobilis]|uniref:Fur family transcriptional regulator n=1 Tax=Alkalibacter mobilis TaxID=2787712 RepID=UPI00189FB502|nr:Fur family transcriptional regulator [Alkalibacter mobilis]MBF7095770.1 transcriptional repressor [Alkalibacter mobilis]